MYWIKDYWKTHLGYVNSWAHQPLIDQEVESKRIGSLENHKMGRGEGEGVGRGRAKLRPRGSQLTAVQQKHKLYAGPWACGRPKPHTGQAGGGREGDTHGWERTRHKTQRSAHIWTNKNYHAYPHINNHRKDDTIRALSHSCISAISFRPRRARVWQSVFCIARHARMTQDSSWPGLKDELQKHKCSRSLFKENPFGHPSLKDPLLTLAFTSTIN